jgi:hypothetical protein
VILAPPGCVQGGPGADLEALSNNNTTEKVIADRSFVPRRGNP